MIGPPLAACSPAADGLRAAADGLRAVVPDGLRVAQDGVRAVVPDGLRVGLPWLPRRLRRLRLCALAPWPDGPLPTMSDLGSTFLS